MWFSEDVVSPDMIMLNYLERLRSVSLDEGDEDLVGTIGGIGGGAAKAAGIGAGASASLAVSCTTVTFFTRAILLIKVVLSV